MADVGYIALVVAGVGAYWWRHVRPMRIRVAPREVFAPDAEVALHVASHEAAVRRQELSSLHVLYGLLQDETVTDAIATAGGNPDALEDCVLAALAVPVRDPRGDAEWLIGHAAAAYHRNGRLATCTDLWAALGHSHAAVLLDKSSLDRSATLFALTHGGREPQVTDDRDVFIVLRNDDYTTQQFVCTMLRDVFGMADVQASSIMLATHTQGRAVVGRFTAPAARAKIHEVRLLSRAQGFPLWIGVEPA